MRPPVFIVGSPRSGTTLLGDILAVHPAVNVWYEPHFVLERYFRNAPNDCRMASDATEKVQRAINESFDRYGKQCEGQIIVDKSPSNSLKMPFLRTIFSDAKFVHIIRDGRDTTLSIAVEWKKRTSTLHNRKLSQMARTTWTWLSRYRRVEHKLGALLFDFGDFSDLLQGGWRVARWTRWGVPPGWGPQFRGWQDVINRISPLEFNALQWTKCVDAILAESRQMDGQHLIEVHYETLLQQPQATLMQVLDFLGLEMPANFMSQLPPLKGNNYSKWETAFSDSEKALIGPILSSLLMQLGYASDDTWYRPRRLK